MAESQRGASEAAARPSISSGHRADGPAQRVRPAAQGRPAADGAGQRRARRARHAAGQAGRSQAAGRAGDDSAPGEGVRREEGSRLRHRRAGRGPVPHQHLPAARHPRVCLPGHPVRSEDHPGAVPPRGAGGDRAQAARAHSGHRHHRLGQVHRARRHDQPREPEPPGQHHHHRGPDRVPPSRRDVQHLPARGRERYPLLRIGAAARAPAGPGRDPRGRNPRHGDAGHRPQGGGYRPPGLLDAAHHGCDPDAQPHHLVLPAATSTRRSACCWPRRCRR